MEKPRFSMRAFAAALEMYHVRPDDWERLCRQCGRCCFERAVTDEGDVVVNFAAPCEFLDLQTRLCSVYDDRFVQCARCRKLTPSTVFFEHHLPKECAYVQTFLNRSWRDDA